MLGYSALSPQFIKLIGIVLYKPFPVVLVRLFVWKDKKLSTLPVTITWDWREIRD
uniref:hypothetical protein n=1 Tax=Microseira wollei TaxID=467598 RepID=UPI001CFD9F6D|nr:hypothetical protein [Microseira wollei]